MVGNDPASAAAAASASAPASAPASAAASASASLLAAPPREEVCGGRGVCQYGRCFCEPGHYGRNCSLPISCPRGCGGEEQGVCANGRCYCTRGWSGDDCTTPEVQGEIGRSREI